MPASPLAEAVPPLSPRWTLARKWLVTVGALVALGLVLQVAISIAVLRGSAYRTSYEWLHNIARNGVFYFGEQTSASLGTRARGWLSDPAVGGALNSGDAIALRAAIETGEADAEGDQSGIAWLARLRTGEIVGSIHCPEARTGITAGTATAKMCGREPVIVTAVAAGPAGAWLAAVRTIDDEYLRAVEAIAGAHAAVIGPSGFERTTMLDQKGQPALPATDLSGLESEDGLLGASFGKVTMSFSPPYDGYRLGTEALAVGSTELDAYLMTGPFLAGDSGSAVRLGLVVPAIVTEIGAYYVSIAIALTGAVLLVLLLLLASSLVRSHTRPLRALTEAVSGLRIEDLAAHVPDQGVDEVAGLGRAFNTMLQRIADSRARVLQTEKMAAIGQLAGGVAHEINNPLAVILGFAQAVERRIGAEDPLRMPIASIVRESLRCKSLVHELLVFSRTAKTHAEPIAICEIAESAALLLAPRAKTDGIELAVDIEPGLPLVEGNRTQLQQVVVNLGANALDATPPGGRVAVRIDGDEDGVHIEVSDTGEGIPQPVLKRIFEPFFTTKEPGRGTGLGLSLVFEIVQQHGGTIEVESLVGVGTTFVVRLPCARAASRTQEAA